MPKAKTDPGHQALEERRREVDDGEILHRELRPVDVERPREPQATFALRLAPEDVAEIRRLARDRGLGPTQLVRSWVVERLHAPAASLDDASIKQIVDQLRPGLTDVVREAAKASREGRVKRAPTPRGARLAPAKARPRAARATTARKQPASAAKSRARKS